MPSKFETFKMQVHQKKLKNNALNRDRGNHARRLLTKGTVVVVYTIYKCAVQVKKGQIGGPVESHREPHENLIISTD